MTDTGKAGAYRELTFGQDGSLHTRPWDGEDKMGKMINSLERLDGPYLNADAALTSIAMSLKRIADRIAPRAPKRRREPLMVSVNSEKELDAFMKMLQRLQKASEEDSE